MGVPTSAVGYPIATTRKETTKVHKNMWWHWKKKRLLFLLSCNSRLGGLHRGFEVWRREIVLTLVGVEL
jgi:hypothetical protein